MSHRIANPPVLAGPIEREKAGGQRSYVLELKDEDATRVFECTAADAGLVTTFSLDGENILADSRVGPMYGSTFWTSPQSDWEWPPPPAIGENPYSVSVEEDTNAIVLTSEKDPQLGVRVVKRFRADVANRSIELNYDIANVGTEARSFAPWEISRVLPGGITFYPKGDGEVGCGPKAPLPTLESDGITWFHHTPANVKGEHKLFADGQRGWLAHAAGRLLFVKAFDDTPLGNAAPGEAEIEIYATPEYVEVEAQGAYTEIGPGMTLSWQVRWFLTRLPDSIEVKAPNPELAAFVDRLLLDR
jgi:hypothetical protein